MSWQLVGFLFVLLVVMPLLMLLWDRLENGDRRR